MLPHEGDEHRQDRQCHHARQHPRADEHWKSLRPSPADYRRISIPILTITGHYDDDQYAYVYAQWGDTRAALDWLATAERTRASALQNLKVRWFLDPIRNEPEFKALESRLNFPP